MFAPCSQISDHSAIRVSNRESECSSTPLGEPTDSKENHIAEERGSRAMKEDAYAEIFLWNQNVDRLVRVLQRLEFVLHPSEGGAESLRGPAGGDSRRAQCRFRSSHGHSRALI